MTAREMLVAAEFNALGAAEQARRAGRGSREEMRAVWWRSAARALAFIVAD